MNRLAAFFAERIVDYPDVQAVNLGGGIPHPYRPGGPPIDLKPLAQTLANAQTQLSRSAGREIRVIVKPEDIDDLEATRLARNIAKQVEEGMSYPGQIKVTVIRETRSVDYAR